MSAEGDGSRAESNIYPISDEASEAVGDSAGCEESAQPTSKLCPFVEGGHVEDGTRIETAASKR